MGSEAADHGVPEANTQPFERQLAENFMEYMIFILDDKLEASTRIISGSETNLTSQLSMSKA